MDKKKILILSAVVLLGGVGYFFMTKKKKVAEIPLPNKPQGTSGNTSNGNSNDAPNNASENSSNNDSSNTSTTLGKPKIVINSAFYGERDNKLDIKKNIEDLVKLGIYQFRPTNNFFGKDPSPKNPKYVFIDYTVDGVKVPLAVFNSETPSFRPDIDAVREGQLVTLYKKA